MGSAISLCRPNAKMTPAADDLRPPSCEISIDASLNAGRASMAIARCIRRQGVSARMPVMSKLRAIDAAPPLDAIPIAQDFKQAWYARRHASSVRKPMARSPAAAAADTARHATPPLTPKSNIAALLAQSMLSFHRQLLIMKMICISLAIISDAYRAMHAPLLDGDLVSC